MILPPPGSSVAQLAALASSLRGNVWARMMSTAQKRALIWWRDRTVPPGLAARFTNAGVKFYGFGNRLRKPSSQWPFYHVTGALAASMRRRKAKTRQASKNGGKVETTMSFGGGALNLMDTTGKPNMRPVTGWQRTTRQQTSTFNVSGYTRSTKSGSVQVKAYPMTRTVTHSKAVPIRSGPTHAAAFGRFTKDAPAIQARVQVELRRLLRETAIDGQTGKIKSSLMASGE